MSWIRTILLNLIRMWTGRLALSHLKRRSLLVYLRTLQAVRRSLLAAVVFACCLQLLVIGAVGTFVTGVLLTDQEWATKLWILFGGFATLLALPAVALTILLSERVWFKASGAGKLFSDIPSNDTEKGTNLSANFSAAP